MSMKRLNLIVIIMILALTGAGCRRAPEEVLGISTPISTTEVVRATETPRSFFSTPPKPTPFPTASPFPKATPFGVDTQKYSTSIETPEVDRSRVIETDVVNACPGTAIPQRVRDREGLVPGYEAGYLPENGMYPETLLSPAYALMIPDDLVGRPRFWDGQPYEPNQVMAGMWTLPPGTQIRAWTDRAVIDLTVLEIGPTYRTVDRASMQKPAELALSRAAWQVLFDGADAGPYPVWIDILSCGS
jgi:hypothetical protein